MLNKHPLFIVREQAPFNAGPPLHLLRQAFLTPNELFFVRNHAPVPTIDPATYRLTVNGLVDRPLSLSLAELQTRFPQRQVVATLQCAGNRRQELLPYGHIPGELHWGEEALSTAEWGGASLADILEVVGIQVGAAHVAFLGLDEIKKNGATIGFGGSIPVDKARCDEVLLAWEMNGAPLPPEHGFPLRVVVPGYLGARSVKWLSEITVQTSPSDNYYQAQAYKLFSSADTPESADWATALMLGEMPITSVICEPIHNAHLSSPVRVRGYALTSGGRGIARVEVSANGGRHWTQATLEPEQGAWAWRLWSAELSLPPGPHELVARAWDTAATTQPEHIESVWNFKGYYNNAWHRVKIEVG